ncbi:hypothetical protein SynROS8604_02210 [Synechococcus sp. ROS8604]|nr:hypothetical protein SynROS8604_02210 [Synechococcus sp. ROS8604]
MNVVNDAFLGARVGISIQEFLFRIVITLVHALVIASWCRFSCFPT